MARMSLTRRRFLAASRSARWRGKSPGPICVAPPTGRSSPMGCNPATSAPIRGVVWARADRPARMQVEIATSDSFKDDAHGVFVDALPESDFTAKVLIEDLPAGQDIFYRIRFQDLSSPTIVGEPMVGRFRTAPRDRRSISFVWSGDTAGQGWGIDEARGGMRTYATMLRQPPGFLHPFRRHDLCRRAAGRRAEAAERRDLAEPRHRGEVEGGRDARASFAATTNTICSTRMCSRSTPRSRCSRNGTITRSPTTGGRASR